MNEPFLLSNLIDLQEIDNEIYKIESQKAEGEDVVHLKELEIKFQESSKLLELAKNKLSDYFTQLEKNELDTKIIRTNAYFQKIKEITKLAILPGSGTQFMDEIINEADVFLTGDISHRYFLLADDNKLGLVQINHI